MRGLRSRAEFPAGRQLLKVSLVGVVCCVVALVVAGRWGETGERTSAYVTDCAVWFPDADAYRCDYHWSGDGQRFSGRFRGEDWPDGHYVGLWVDPDDPAHVDSDKNVVLPVVFFAAFGLGLLLVAGRLVGWTRTREVTAVLGRTVVLGVVVVAAAVPAAAIVSRSVRRPDVRVLVAFGSGGATLAVAEGNTVRLWDVASLRATATLFGHGAGLYSVGFGPDGTTLGVYTAVYAVGSGHWHFTTHL
jgi:hypothetical protein